MIKRTNIGEERISGTALGRVLRGISGLRTGNIIIISGLLIAVLIGATVYEYRSNREDVYSLLYEYSESIHHLVLESSSNSIVSNEEIEGLMAEHLLGTARTVRRLDSLNGLNEKILTGMAKDNNVYRINVFNRERVREVSNLLFDTLMHKRETVMAMGYLEGLFEGREEEVIIGLKTARFERGSRYAVAVRRANNKGVIVVNLDAEAYIDFKEKIGFDKLISDLGTGKGIKYILLQSPEGVMSTNVSGKRFSAISEDIELGEVYETGRGISRITEYEDGRVLESISLLKTDGKKAGIIRVGLSLEAVQKSDREMLTRNAVVTIAVILLTAAVFFVIVTNKNSRLVSEEYERIQTLTGNIIETLTPALITLDEKGEIIIFNRSAFKMFSMAEEDLEGLRLERFNDELPELYEILAKRRMLTNFEMELKYSGEIRVFLLNTVSTEGSDLEMRTYSLLIEDLTNIRRIERELSRNERFTAMGELASSVAHEIRNPLNTIIMISQRLEREYKPRISSGDFDSLLQILHSESRRVNDIIEQFLKFTKPPRLVITESKVSDFLNETVKIASVQALEKGIEIETGILEDGVIKIDYVQMKQAFINLLRNAIDATEKGGKVRVEYISERANDKFIVSDNGAGISSENLERIFDIYFTTKQTGTGMGLSIVRQP